MNLNMAEPAPAPQLATDIRLKAVLAVVAGESLGAVARRFGVEGLLLERWYRQFLTAGTAALANERTGAREEAVLRFYSALSDEMRGGVAALGGWVELLAAARSSEDAREAAAAARHVLDRLRTLSDDARDSARVALGDLGDELRIERVDLAAVVEAVAGSGPGVQFVSPGPTPVAGDRGRLVQVVRALLGAAGRHGGAVQVALRRRPAWVELTATSDQPMPFEALQGLFQPFSQPPGIGDGSGLHVTHALVEAHGGQIGVHADDASTTLWMRLPAADEDGAQR